MGKTGDGLVDAATLLTVVPSTFTSRVACIAAGALSLPSGS